jgi:hypothetical protein
VRTPRLTPSILVLVMLLAGGSAIAGGAEPEPTPVPTKAPEAPSPRHPQTLADVAGRIHLHKLAGEEGSTPEITNANLRALAAQGVISTGTATAPSPTPQPEAGTTIPIALPPQEVAKARYEEQLHKVKVMEQDLADFDKSVAESRTPQTSSLPQNLPPGVRDQNLITREDAVANLEAEKTKLEELRRRAESEGATPTPAPQ